MMATVRVDMGSSSEYSNSGVGEEDGGGVSPIVYC